MTTPSLVSVVIPVYNGERYLAEAISSVLAQGYPRVELLVVDDGSNDASVAIAGKFPEARVLRQPHQGAAAARNHGVAFSQGELLAFLDADDLWQPGKLLTQVKALADDPELEMVFGSVEQFHSPELSTEERARIHIPVEVSTGAHIGAMLIRRASYLRVGELNAALKLGEFIDWYARAMDAGIRSRLIPDVAMRRRLHKCNLGLRGRDHLNDYAQVAKSILDRRRRQSAESEVRGSGPDGEQLA
jgi:glycosyltransferase involved in cell wall biosynthesis